MMQQLTSAILLACLACVGHGRRMQMPSRKAEDNLSLQRRSHSRVVPQQVQNNSTGTDLTGLSRLLLALTPKVAPASLPQSSRSSRSKPAPKMSTMVEERPKLSISGSPAGTKMPNMMMMRPPAAKSEGLHKSKSPIFIPTTKREPFLDSSTSFKSLHEEVKNLHEKAMSLSDSGHHSEAAPVFDDMLNHGRMALHGYRARVEKQMQVQAEADIIMMREIFDLRCRKLGRDHPDTVKSMASLADTLAWNKRQSEAELLKKEVVEIMSKRFGPEDPKTLKAMNSYASTLGELGQEAKALEISKKVLEGMQHALNPDHPDTLVALHDYAEMLCKLGRHKEAEPFKHEVLERRSKTLGPEHQDTLKAMNSYADCLIHLGRTTEAESLKKEMVRLAQQSLGADHEDTIEAMRSYAETIGDISGREAEAAPLKKEVLELTRKKHGPKHRDTLKAMGDYAETLKTLGQMSKSSLLSQEMHDLTHQGIAQRHAVMSNFPRAITEVHEKHRSRLQESWPKAKEPVPA